MSCYRISCGLLGMSIMIAGLSACQLKRNHSTPNDIYTADSKGNVYFYRGGAEKVSVRKCPAFAPLKAANSQEEIEAMVEKYCPATQDNEKSFSAEGVRKKLLASYSRNYISEAIPVDIELTNKINELEKIKQTKIEESTIRKASLLEQTKVIQVELAKLETYFAANPDLLTDQVKKEVENLKARITSNAESIARLNPEKISIEAESMKSEAFSKAYGEFMDKHLFKLILDESSLIRISSNSSGADIEQTLEDRLYIVLSEMWNFQILEAAFSNKENIKLEISCDGSELFLGHDGSIEIWSTKTRLLLKSIEVDGRVVKIGTDHACTKMLVLAKRAYIIDLKSRQLIHEFETGMDIDGGTFNQSGSTIAIWSNSSPALTKFFKLSESGAVNIDKSETKEFRAVFSLPYGDGFIAKYSTYRDGFGAEPHAPGNLTLGPDGRPGTIVGDYKWTVEERPDYRARAWNPESKVEETSNVIFSRQNDMVAYDLNSYDIDEVSKYDENSSMYERPIQVKRTQYILTHSNSILKSQKNRYEYLIFNGGNGYRFDSEGNRLLIAQSSQIKVVSWDNTNNWAIQTIVLATDGYIKDAAFIGSTSLIVAQVKQKNQNSCRIVIVDADLAMSKTEYVRNQR